MKKKTITYETVGFTGNWFFDGEKEVGWRCGHKHRVFARAQACLCDMDHGHGASVRAYDAEGRWIKQETEVE